MNFFITHSTTVGDQLKDFSSFAISSNGARLARDIAESMAILNGIQVLKGNKTTLASYLPTPSENGTRVNKPHNLLHDFSGLLIWAIWPNVLQTFRLGSEKPKTIDCNLLVICIFFSTHNVFLQTSRDCFFCFSRRLKIKYLCFEFCCCRNLQREKATLSHLFLIVTATKIKKIKSSLQLTTDAISSLCWSNVLGFS